jgi:tellurite resistance protein
MVIERLRDRLLGQGRPSLLPGGAGARVAADAQALYQRLLPFAEAMYLVMSADGSVSARERDILRGALRVLTGGALSSAAMESMIAEFDRTLVSEGTELRLDQLASTLYGDREDAELVLSLMAAVASADGVIAARERALLDATAERLGVARARVQELLGET